MLIMLVITQENKRLNFIETMNHYEVDENYDKKVCGVDRSAIYVPNDRKFLDENYNLTMLQFHHNENIL